MFCFVYKPICNCTAPCMTAARALLTSKENLRPHGADQDVGHEQRDLILNEEHRELEECLAFSCCNATHQAHLCDAASPFAKPPHQGNPHHSPTNQPSTHRKLLEQLWGSARGENEEGALTQFRVPHVVKPQQLVVVAILVIDLGSMARGLGVGLGNLSATPLRSRVHAQSTHEACLKNRVPPTKAHHGPVQI